MSLTDCLARIRKDMTERVYLVGNGPSVEWSCVHADDLQALIDVAEAAREYVEALAEVTRVYDAGEMTVGDAQAICESKTDALVAAVGEVPDATH